MVEHMGSVIQITTPYDVFGVRRKCCIIIESLKDFTYMRPIATVCLDAYIMYLYTRMESSRTLNLYKFVDAGSISCGSFKEERAQLLTARLLGTDYDQLLLIFNNFGNHWTLVVINLMKGAAFWIDPLKNRIDPDITKVVERSFNLMNKKKPNWRVMKMKDSPRAYTQDDIDCIRSEWAEFVGKHCYVVDHEVLLKCVVDKIVLLKCVVHHEVLLKCLVDKKVLLKCVVDVQVLLLKGVVDKKSVLLMCVVDVECVVDKKVLLKCVVDYEVLLKCFVDHEVLLKCVLRQSIGAMKPYLRQFIDV
ncbi:hypothetical protein IC582_001020 [Cucumis melo]